MDVNQKTMNAAFIHFYCVLLFPIGIKCIFESAIKDLVKLNALDFPSSYCTSP